MPDGTASHPDPAAHPHADPYPQRPQAPQSRYVLSSQELQSPRWADPFPAPPPKGRTASDQTLRWAPRRAAPTTCPQQSMCGTASGTRRRPAVPDVHTRSPASPHPPQRLSPFGSRGGQRDHSARLYPASSAAAHPGHQAQQPAADENVTTNSDMRSSNLPVTLSVIDRAGPRAPTASRCAVQQRPDRPAREPWIVALQRWLSDRFTPSPRTVASNAHRAGQSSRLVASRTARARRAI